MNTITKQLVGTLIGAFVGNFVSGVIIEIIRIKESPEATEPYEDSPEYPEGDDLDVEKTLTAKRPEKMKTQTPKKDYTKHFLAENRPDLAALAAKYNGEEPGEVVEGEIVVEAFEEEELEDPNTWVEEVETELKDPRIISLSEFANAEDVNIVKLNYYDDDVLTDERDNPIERPERLLGDDALVSFGQLSDDEDVVYVRNSAKKAVYEVVRTNKNYSAPVDRRRRPSKEEDHGEEDDS